MPKIVLFNPHLDNWYAKSLCDWLFRKTAIVKYSHILTGLYEQGDLVIFVDKRRSSFDALGVLKIFFPKGRMEAFFWCLVNGMSPFRVKIVADKTKLQADDRLFLFAFQTLDYKNAYKQFISFKSGICIHLSHYFLDVELLTANFRKLSINFLLSESNLNESSPFFVQHFGNNYTTKGLPFSFSERFKKIKQFGDRERNCVALGSLSCTHDDSPRYAAFNNYFKTIYLCPFRKTLFDEKENLANLIDVMIENPYNVKRHLPKAPHPKNNTISKTIHLISRIVSRFRSVWSNYYDLDIVRTLNQYKMFIAPEAAAGFPAALFVEGMACGCVYIGLNNILYKELGMESGVHYIGYDGTLEDLIEKVKYYNANQDMLEKISSKGYEFALCEFNQAAVYKKFVEMF